jgi:hypothetical protein
MNTPRSGTARRGRGEDGMAMVTGLVLIFAFTAGAVIWLAADVNRSVGNRSAAQSIAFQAARSGAQQIEPESLRLGSGPVIDPVRADSAARRTADELFGGYGVAGEVLRVVVEPGTVEVAVRIDDPAGAVTGVASARAQVGP